MCEAALLPPTSSRRGVFGATIYEGCKCSRCRTVAEVDEDGRIRSFTPNEPMKVRLVHSP
jgi:hypothetical protein